MLRRQVRLFTGAVLGQCCFPARYCATTGPLGPHSADICAGAAVAVHRRSTASLRAAEANPHGPACSGYHRDSAVAVGQVVDALLCWSCGFTGCSSPCTAQCLVRQWIQNFASVYGDIRVFLRENVDYGSRLSGVSASTGLWSLLGDDFRNVSVSPRFDSGYIFGVSLRVLWKNFIFST